VRSYDVAAASLAVCAPRKWTDNLISQHTIDGVISARRGIARRISRAALLRIAVIHRLNAVAGIGVADSVRLAGELLASGTSAVSLPGHITLAFDRGAIEAELDERLRDVLESAPAPRRGRPPRRL
jgi:hypothetical protein